MWLDGNGHAIALLGRADGYWNSRGLPWRAPEEWFDRRALVEGLLAQTRADAVAAAYAGIFAGVQTAQDWLGQPEEARLARVAPLGLPLLKLRAVDGIARVLCDGPFLPEPAIGGLLDKLDAQPGIGPYTAAMVALLLGFPAAPVDTNIDRVGRRVAPDRAPAVWIAEVVAAAAGMPSSVALPAPYVAVSMALDVGATVCAAGQLPECERCPLYGRCWYSQKGKIQRLLPL
jgi:endonuclease III